MKLGRRAPTLEQRQRALPLARYLRAALPPAPVALDNTAGVEYKLYGNDVYGDCTIAALANYLATCAVREGRSVSFTDNEVINYYFRLTGGPDHGLVEHDVLESARTNGFPLSGAHKLAAWVRLNVFDLEALRSTAALFYAVYVGVALPLSAQTSKLWDATGATDGNNAPSSWGGHAMIMPAYDETGPMFITWGEQKRATWAWWRTYVDEAYALLDAERAQAAGVDWAALMRDMQALEGWL